MTDQEILSILSEQVGEDVPATSTIGEIGMDSLDVADFAFNLEKKFGIKVDLSDIKSNNTIAEMLKTIKDK